IPLVIPAAGGSGFIAATEIPTLTEKGQESIAEEDAYLELADSGKGTAMIRQSGEEVVTEQPKKIKKKRLTKQRDVLSAKKLRTDHLSLASGTGGNSLLLPLLLLLKKVKALWIYLPKRASRSALLWGGISSTLSAPVDTAAATTTSTKAKLSADVNPDLVGPSQLEESEGSDDSFYKLATLDPSEAKRWYVPRRSVGMFLGEALVCSEAKRWYVPRQGEALFNVGVARQICLGSEVKSRAEHELELKEKPNAKYTARGKLLEKKDSEILRLKSQLAEKEAEAAEVVRLRDRVSSLSGEKPALTTGVPALKVTITQKDHDISLLDSRVTHLELALNDAQVACTEAWTKITSLA
ncbi:hypothetical protein Tco_1581362, partial [Tanacetum coccineum]